MDKFRETASAIVKFLLDQGIIVFARTVGGGFALGPAGAALGGVAGAVATTAAALIRSPRWATLVQGLLRVVSSIITPIVNMPWFQRMTRNVADFIARLLRSVGILPTSTVYESLMPGPGYTNRRDDRDGAPPPTC